MFLANVTSLLALTQVLSLERKSDRYETAPTCKSENVLLTSIKELELRYKGQKRARDVTFYHTAVEQSTAQEDNHFWGGKKKIIVFKHIVKVAASHDELSFRRA